MPADNGTGRVCFCNGRHVGKLRVATEVVQKLNAEITRITQTPEVQKLIAELGSEPMSASVDAMTTMVRQEKRMWGDLVKAKKITVD